MTDIDRLIRIASTLTTTKLKLLTEMAQAMTRQVEFEKGDTPANPLDNEVIAGYFSNRLVVHHATQEEKFSKKAFEYAFRDACRAAGMKAEIIVNPTNPGADLLVGEEKWSLKTEAAKSISREKIMISKLMEARWIRDCNSKQEFAQQTAHHVIGHLNRYDRILILRAFDINEPSQPGSTETTDTAKVRYELWEIPRELLRKVATLEPDHFSNVTTNHSTTAKVYADNTLLFNLRLDGSVEKITVSSLRTDQCLLHGKWTLPTLPPGGE
jgi:hypothetical protein